MFFSRTPPAHPRGWSKPSPVVKGVRDILLLKIHAFYDTSPIINATWELGQHEVPLLCNQQTY